MPLSDRPHLFKLIEDLEYAKNAVLSMIKEDGVLVDMKGLRYWASEVERLRKVIKENL